MYLKWCAIATAERRSNDGNVEQTDDDFVYDLNVVCKEMRQQKLEAMKQKAQAVQIKAQEQARELRAVAVSWLDSYNPPILAHESSIMDVVPGARHSAAHDESESESSKGVYVKVTWEQHTDMWGLEPTDAEVEDGADPHINEAPYFSHHDHLNSFVFRMPGGKWGVAGHDALEYSMTSDANDATLLGKPFSPTVVSDKISYSPLGGDGKYEYVEGKDHTGSPQFVSNTDVPQVFKLAAADAPTLERYEASRARERSIALDARALEVRGALAEAHQLSGLWLPLADTDGDKVLFNSFPVFEHTGGIDERYILLNMLEGARWVVCGGAALKAGDARERRKQLSAALSTESAAANSGLPSYSPIGEYVGSENSALGSMVVSIAHGDEVEAAIALRALIAREKETALALGGVRVGGDEAEWAQLSGVAEFVGMYQREGAAGSTVAWRTETLGNDIAIDMDSTRITRTSSSSWGSHVTCPFTEDQVRCPFPSLTPSPLPACPSPFRSSDCALRSSFFAVSLPPVLFLSLRPFYSLFPSLPILSSSFRS